MSSPVVFWIFCVCSTRKVVGPDWIVYKHSTVLSCKLMSPWFSLLDPKVVWMQTSIVCIGSRDSSRLKKKKKTSMWNSFVPSAICSVDIYVLWFSGDEWAHRLPCNILLRLQLGPNPIQNILDQLMQTMWCSLHNLWVYIFW
jgi:hypothetical protein